MTLLIYAFFSAGQLLIGMAEFDSLDRCQKQLPAVQEQYPGGGAACVIVQRP